MPLITKAGFSPVPAVDFATLDTLAEGGALDVSNDTDAQAVLPVFNSVSLIRIPFPSSQDGRGFSLAQRLRDLGYQGRLRAEGQIISDQFRYALECGFDEVEIDDALAARQPEAHWTADPPLARTYRDKLSGRGASFPVPSGVFAETVTSVQHYTDRLFKFRITRPDSFRFRSGEFVMIGLPNAEKPVFRAYSIASPSWDEELEFFSIKVPDGPLTEHLQRISPGDTVLMRKKPTGTLVLDALLPGKRLFMISTGTGIAPFASLIRDPDTYEKFEQVILTHTCRDVDELAYGTELIETAKADPLVGAAANQKLTHYATTTRESSSRMGRITTLIDSGKLFDDLGQTAFDPAMDRVMICGSVEMLHDVKALCDAAGLTEGSNASPGTYVVERAFVD